MLVTGSGELRTGGSGISGAVGKVICMGSGIPCSRGPSRPRESEAGLVRVVTGAATGLGIGVGIPAGIEAKGAGCSIAAAAAGTPEGDAAGEASCSAVGKFSFMIALTFGEAAGAGETAGVWATRGETEPAAKRRAKIRAAEESVMGQWVFKPAPRSFAKPFRVRRTNPLALAAPALLPKRLGRPEPARLPQCPERCRAASLQP